MSRKFSERAEAYLLSVIEDRREGWQADLLRVLLRVLSWVFTAVVRLRLWLYRMRILRDRTLGCQVISVGNLTVGGTGKTPVVEAFARSLHLSGRKVAILSRGYKKAKTRRRKSRRGTAARGKRPAQPEKDEMRVVSDGSGPPLMSSYLAGDEPYMLASNLPGVAVIVGKNRVESGRYAVRKLKCDTLILDDGFQHLHLKHRLDIVLVDRTNPFGNEATLPRGVLREPVENIKRAGFIILTKCNGDGSADLKNRLREHNPTAEFCECRHAARHVVEVSDPTRKKLPLSILKGMKIIAMSGIAAPQGFIDELRRQGAEVVDQVRFSDHHRYSPDEIEEVVERGLAAGAQAVLTTEKDAVRMPEDRRWRLPIHYLRVEIEMLSGAEDFRKWISKICYE